MAMATNAPFTGLVGAPMTVRPTMAKVGSQFSKGLVRSSQHALRPRGGKVGLAARRGRPLISHRY